MKFGRLTKSDSGSYFCANLTTQETVGNLDISCFAGNDSEVLFRVEVARLRDLDSNNVSINELGSNGIQWLPQKGAKNKHFRTRVDQGTFNELIQKIGNNNLEKICFWKRR